MAAFGLIGKIDPFDETIEPWESYVERFEQYFTVNEIDPGKKVPSLLCLIGGRLYSLLRDLTFPDKPAEKTYQDLVTLLNSHLSPKPIKTAERFRFDKRDQKEGETITEYVAQLKKLSIYCDFNASLNEKLRDRVVCGIRHPHIQKRLLSEKDLTFEKAMEISVAMEAAAKDATELVQARNRTDTGAVNRLHVKNRRSRGNDRKNEVQCYRCGEKGHIAKDCRSGGARCYRCNGSGHVAKDCKFRNAECHNCHNTGHIKKACKTSKPQMPTSGKHERRKPVHYVENDPQDVSDDNYIASLELNNLTSADIIWIHLKINGMRMKMELDTGSAISVMAEEEFRRKFRDLKLKTADITLRTYSGEHIKPVGYMDVEVEYGGTKQTLPLYIVEKGGPALLGRDWLRKIQLDWRLIKDTHAISTVKPTSVSEIIDKYKDVFVDEVGTVKGITAKLTLRENKPKYVKARTVPFSLRTKVEEELQRLEAEGTLTKVQHSDWATPIVPVLKKNGSIRICGDFKVTLNPLLNVDQYPLPKIDDIFANLNGGTHFSKIDLKQAYLQLPVDESCKELLTISTHKGLYRYNRMAFGIASAPAIWQRTIEQVLQGVPGTQCMLDDMVITGKSNEEHLKNLDMVLKRLSQYGLRANLEKCEFFKESITFCGHVIDRNGLHKTPEKIDAIVKAPSPCNVSQLRSFLGLVNYYGKFLPDLATVLGPLHNLLRKDSHWNWTESCEESFNKVKDLVASDLVLTHYSPELPISLACDASPYGLGAVISHELPDGTERPIAFASRTLAPAEKNYSQIDKEALGIIWGIKKFHSYLFGRKFKLITDHQPLIHIFSPQRGVPVTASSRLQRYSLFLSAYDYEIGFRKTSKHANADSMSRLPLKSTESDVTIDMVDAFYLGQIETLPVSSKNIQNETRKDLVLGRVMSCINSDWTSTDKDGELAPYYSRRSELSIHHGCIMWGVRVIIPTKLRNLVISQIHEGHLGVVKMKTLARSFCWWPGIDQDIETIAKRCNGCQQNQNSPKGAPLNAWEWPTKPWERIHIDFAGPFLGYMFLIMVDSHSKWPEVVKMSTTTSTRTIDVLRTIFSRNGLPVTIVSDNGPQFTSREFEEFLNANGIKHIKTSPYHPSSNGLAERFVQTFKQAMKCSKNDTGSIERKLANFLLAYRNTAHATTNETPAKLMMGRELRTKMDLLRPNTELHVKQKQEEMCLQRTTQNREFEPGQSVMMRDYRGKDKWIPGMIAQRTGPVSYRVQVDPSTQWRRHADQIVTSQIPIMLPDVEIPEPSVSSSVSMDNWAEKLKTPNSRSLPSVYSDSAKRSTPLVKPTVAKNMESSQSTPLKPTAPIQSERRYPLRTRQPKILEDYVYSK